MSESLTTFTVATLIEALKKFPQDAPIVVSGYESGYENIQSAKFLKVQQKRDNKYWDGEFQEVTQEDSDTLNAVVLNRRVRSDDS